MQFVYILKCADEGFYVGCTDNLKDRLERHANGYVKATQKRTPVKLHCYFAFNNKYTAYDFERYLKSGSGRASCKKHFDNII